MAKIELAIRPFGYLTFIFHKERLKLTNSFQTQLSLTITILIKMKKSANQIVFQGLKTGDVLAEEESKAMA